MGADAKPSDELIGDKYRLVRLLGKGGMGSVWEGVHVSLGTRVAVKFIEHELLSNEEARRRFDNEARAAARLQSRYVVGIYDHGVMPDGRPFIVMEFLRGESLEDRLAGGGVMPLRKVAVIVAQICRALGKAHEQGIIHRDLKPENIFLARSPDGEEEVAKVVDFGIAKFTAAAPGLSSSTKTGILLGTPFYMSPEQARGLKQIDHRSDLWALGVVAYRSTVGALPFPGEAVGDILVRICTQNPDLPSTLNNTLPTTFDDWFMRCVAKEPDDRFQSAQDLAASLLSIAGISAGSESGPQAQPPGLEPASASGPAIAQEAASQVPLGSEGTQMGASSPVLTASSRPSMGRVGVLVALAGIAIVVVGIAGWRWFAAPAVQDSPVVAVPDLPSSVVVQAPVESVDPVAAVSAEPAGASTEVASPIPAVSKEPPEPTRSVRPAAPPRRGATRPARPPSSSSAHPSSSAQPASSAARPPSSAARPPSSAAAPHPQGTVDLGY